METVTYSALKRLAKQAVGTQTLYILGDCATQQLATAIRGETVRRGRPMTVIDGAYDQFEAMILDAGSPLYEAKPDFVLLWFSVEKCQKRFYHTVPAERISFAERECERICGLWAQLAAHTNAKILCPDFPETDDAVFGSYALRQPISFAYQCRKLNFLLSEAMAATAPQVYPIALSAIANRVGQDAFYRDREWYLAKMAVCTDTLPLLAARMTDVMLGLQGSVKKCVITDLDNTLWGGVSGDDGMDGIALGDLGTGPAFAALQTWLLELKRRGIILCVCSKNEEAIAKEPFLHHPEMILRLEDIAVFVANWEDKASNIRKIRDTLDIGLDSMVFLDDNPFERNLVRGMLPEVTVPELPEDPSEVPQYLQDLHLFEAVSFSSADAERTAQYQAEAGRKALQSSFSDYDAYLESLEMVGVIVPFDAFHYPRIAQLTQRSNQFNLRTVRYTESEIAAISQDDRYITRYMTLSDRFGEHGLISVVILEKQEDALFIDTWLMSCRVLRRGVEECLFDAVVALTQAAGYRWLIGEYLPTAKNGMVAEFYAQLGMESIGEGRYRLDVTNYTPHKTQIKL